MQKNKISFEKCIPPREFQSTGYRKEFIRKRLLQKAMKGTEKGYKSLSKFPETVHTGIEVLWRQQQLCDVTLVSGDKRNFRAHRLVLATCSDYFCDFFTDDAPRTSNERVELQEINGNILDILIESMYTGKVKVEANTVDDILTAAFSLGMFSAMEACEDFLLDLLNKDNCLQILATAVKYDFIRLTEQALQKAARNFLTISKRPAFKMLGIELLILLLQRSDVNVESELEVFQRARSWIEAERPNRLQYAAEVMATIRLPLLSPAQIIDHVECCSFLMGIAECQRLVKDSLHYHLMPARQCLLQVVILLSIVSHTVVCQWTCT